MQQSRDSLDVLAEAALAVREQAYAPYSGYRVGAAIAGECGKVYTGANVENISYGATVCAERNAIGAVVAAGERKITRVAVATLDGGAPCGICLQCIGEFASPDVEILLVTEGGEVVTTSLRALAPMIFGSKSVLREEQPGANSA